jgi:hypothetical protein
MNAAIITIWILLFTSPVDGQRKMIHWGLSSQQECRDWAAHLKYKRFKCDYIMVKKGSL